MENGTTYAYFWICITERLSDTLLAQIKINTLFTSVYDNLKIPQNIIENSSRGNI